MSCPNAEYLLKVGQIDTQAVNLLNQIYQQIQQRMIEKTTKKITKLTNYILFTGTCECTKTEICNLNICDLIQIINKIGPQWIPSTYFYFSIEPFAFAVTDNKTFVPIADPLYGGLMGNPDFYDFSIWPVIYERALQNPYGIYVDFEKGLGVNKNCRYPGRAYVRILPKCFKKYNTVIVGVGFLLESGNPLV